MTGFSAPHQEAIMSLSTDSNISEMSSSSSFMISNESSTDPVSSIHPPVPFDDITIPPCQWILYADIRHSRVRVWDLIILIPNCLFLIFLFFRMHISIIRLRSSNSPIFTAFYGLVFVVSTIGVLRCIVSMTVNAAAPAGDVADKVLWLVLRFFLLATELSVVIFGLAFGHLDSKTSIRRVLLVTFTIALAYSAVQGTLELEYDHPVFTGKSGSSSTNSTSDSYDLFAHGGMIFLFTTSIFFFLIYTVIMTLPFTRLRERFLLPTKRSFYYYCLILALLNLCQAVAAIFLFEEWPDSLCVIDFTTYTYFSFYNPLVYGVFLWNFFRTSSGSLSFSYKHQEDLLDEDQVSLPYSHGVTKQDDQAPIFSYDSTHLDVNFSQSSSTGSFTNVSAVPSMSVNSDVHGYQGDTDNA